jgi:aryl-alcohol dehydrogenase-like predicted oxidoreductase
MFRFAMNHDVTRRKFLGVTLAGGADYFSGRITETCDGCGCYQIYVPIGRRCYGGSTWVWRDAPDGRGIWGWPPDRENAKKVLRRAIELGVNLIDTADAYGPETDELLIAEALHPYPKGLVIATKGRLTRPGPGQWVPNGRPEYLSQCVDKSLKRLKLDRIDLYQLHTVDRKVPIEESLGALKAAQDAGKIRHVGLSNVTTQEIERAKKILPIVSIQNRYNIEDRDSEEVLSYCEKEKMGFLPWAPVGGSGRSSLTKTGNPLEAEAKRRNVSAVQLALAWLLQKSPVILPIPGTSSLAHLEENMAAAKLQLTPEEWKKIEDSAGKS